MANSWTKAFTAGIPSYQKDTQALSLNVLVAAGFRKSYESRGSLQTVFDHIILLMLVPFRGLNHGSCTSGHHVPERY
ncbi:hypothetical protein F5Y06DRAFT_174728 [Hypoxylon sp. FL0890]|nr:hypothetical protein F5Y06DRAFT_174728 [Hypoxylon sp. FL0890]